MASLKAFIVEDSPVVSEYLTAALEEMAPIQVVGIAETESAAIEWLLAPGSRCDLMIVDLLLKSGSGLGVLHFVSDMRSPPQSVVVLSNYATPEMRRKCLKTGAGRVFDKSMEIDALMAYCRVLGAAPDGSSAIGSASS